jgi:predicted nucleic acid-binding protein
VTVILADATVLIALGNASRLDLLSMFDGSVVVVDPVQSEVTTEPAASGLRTSLDTGTIERSDLPNASDKAREASTTAKELLGEEGMNGDIAIIGEVLRQQQKDGAVAVLSDDRRVRRVAEGLGATVTGTIGVVVRVVSDDELTGTEGKQLVERLDERGLHMTGELRQRAIELVEDAARD